MKRIIFLSLMFTFLMSSLSLEAQNKKTQKVATTVSNKIEVYYFHLPVGASLAMLWKQLLKKLLPKCILLSLKKVRLHLNQ